MLFNLLETRQKKEVASIIIVVVAVNIIYTPFFLHLAVFKSEQKDGSAYGKLKTPLR